jgi:lipopolysaccharide/colanic/teichoic acid biosynthesis glycosyltransferase
MIKRLFDFFVASLGIIALIPLFFILYFLILWRLGQPVIFAQIRPGLYGKPFKLYKFRSMADEKDCEGNLLPDAERLDIFGSRLRALSFDELPALWNVIKGDMSLVGPRPLLMEYLPLYSKKQAQRHEVRPGITGWAQINGRNAISWRQKFKLDVWYIHNQSFLLDLRILLLTGKKVLLKSDISAKNHATVERFTGLN